MEKNIIGKLLFKKQAECLKRIVPGSSFVEKSENFINFT